MDKKISEGLGPGAKLLPQSYLNITEEEWVDIREIIETEKIEQ